MENDTQAIIEKAQELGDLALAILLCLISSEHCIIEADGEEDIANAGKELQSTCSGTFEIQSVALSCNAETTIDAFAEGLLIPDEECWREESRNEDGFRMERNDGEGRRIADVVIVRDLNSASVQVQYQALELMRSGRIYTRKAMYTTPKRFLLIALNSATVDEENGPSMVVHLNDHFHISHFYTLSSEEDDFYAHTNGSTGSVVRSRPPTPGFLRSTSYRSTTAKAIISSQDMTHLTTLSNQTKLHPDIRAYMHNLTVFLRNHRALARGVSPHATRHLYKLVHALAPLHGLDYITPAIVQLAVRKVYPHRLVLVKVEDEWSMAWGSEEGAVRAYLEGLGVEDVVEDVLAGVEVPL